MREKGEKKFIFIQILIMENDIFLGYLNEC